MTAFDNIKTNNWPSASNEFEDFLVLELPFNDQAALTSSRRDIVAGNKVLFPKRTLTNTQVTTQYARVQPDYGATGFSKSTNWRENTHAAPEIGLFNGDGTSTQPAVNGDNTEHWFEFATPLTNVTKVETRMGHDGYQSARAYMGNGTTAYVYSGAHAAYFTVYSGAATTFSKIGWRSNNGSGASVYDIRITDDTGTYVLTSNQNEKKHYDNNASFNGSSVIDVLASSDYAFSGDFTIEFWVNTSAKTADGVYRRMFVLDGPTGDTGTNLSLNIDASSGHVIAWGGNAGPGAIVNQGVNIADGAWHHVACVRQGTSVSIYVDGSIQGTGTDSRSLFAGSTPAPRLGGASTSSGRMNGFMQDVRVYKGVAKYTSNFTPPSAILG